MHFNNSHILIKVLDNFTRILPYVFWGLLIFSFDKPHFAILTLISSAIHECGHLFAAAAVRSGAGLEGKLYGMRIRISEGTMSYTGELIILSAGPLANLVAFLVSLPSVTHPYIAEFAFINILSAISNLLPVESYDGYRIIEILCHSFGKSFIAARLLRYVSFVCVFIIVIFSLFLMAKLNTGYWIYFIFLFSLLRTLKRSINDDFEEK